MLENEYHNQTEMPTMSDFLQFYNNKITCLSILEIMNDPTEAAALEADRRMVLDELYLVKMTLQQQIANPPAYLKPFETELHDFYNSVVAVYGEVFDRIYNPATGYAVMDALAKITSDPFAQK